MLILGSSFIVESRVFFFSSRRRHTRLVSDWSSDVCSSDLADLDHPALRVLAEKVARSVNGFEPDIIIGFAGQANHLGKLWPTALRLHIERGWLDRKSVV